MKYGEIINQMTLEEKASMFSGKDFWSSQNIDRLDIPSLVLADGPHGIRKQEDEVDHLGLHSGSPATCFPTSATIANSWDEKLAESIGVLLGREAVAKDVDVILGPGLNIKRSPLCGRNFEYFSEDPYLSGKLAAAFIRGIQENNVAACPKHFAVNNQELLRMTIDAVVDERTLREIYLTGFEIAVKEGKAKSLMTSYNKVNGIYTNENHELLQEILRDEWGFSGFVVTDWGGSNDHIEGIKAGSHLEMPGNGGVSDIEVIKAVKNGDLAEEILDKRLVELLKNVFELKENEENSGEIFDKDLHHKKAKEAAEKSIVMLKNQEKILPLDKEDSVAVIGDFAENSRYQGSGSSLVSPTRLENALEAIRNSKLNMLGFEPGFERFGKENKELKDRACKLADGADVVLLYLGLDESIESEGMDRPHMQISQNQIELLESLNEINENIVVILSGGSAVKLDWIDNCKSLLYTCLPGQAGAGAIVNILTGKVCPSGKLSESFPLEYKDTPAYNYFPGSEKTVEHREALYVGYRYYDSAEVEVQFPFGYGLSYTEFKYSDLKSSSDKVSFTITNTGEIAGAEIAQLYVGLEESKIFRPEKELKGFKKVFLEPGESKGVEIELDDKAFRYYNVKTHKFEVEAGEYSIFVAASSRDIRLKEKIKIEGTAAELPYNEDQLFEYYKADIKDISDESFSKLINGEIPETKWNRNKKLGRNDSLSQLFYAESFLARIIFKIMNFLKTRSEKKGKPDLNILYLLNMPFRAIAKMSGGLFNMEMVDNVVEIVNGHFFKGTGNLIKSWFNKRKALKDWNNKLNSKKGGSN